MPSSAFIPKTQLNRKIHPIPNNSYEKYNKSWVKEHMDFLNEVLTCENDIKSKPRRIWNMLSSIIMCFSIMDDIITHDISNIAIKDITKNSIQYVCRTYLFTYEQQISLGTIISKKRADIIRARLVDIIRTYTPGFNYAFLKSNDDIDKIRNIININSALHINY